MKSYTDIEQSKKLAEILPLESADYFYAPDADVVVTESYITYLNGEKNTPAYKDAVPCWSLAALLNIIPEGIIKNYYVPNLQKEDCKYSITYGDDELLCIANNPIDACVAMVEKLHELKML